VIILREKYAPGGALETLNNHLGQFGSYRRVTHSPLRAHWLSKEISRGHVEVSHLDALQGFVHGACVVTHCNMNKLDTTPQTGTRQCILGTLACIEEESIYLEDAHAATTRIFMLYDYESAYLSGGTRLSSWMFLMLLHSGAILERAWRISAQFS